MTQKHSFTDVEKQAVYRAIAERRDMRHFNGEPMAEETLRKILVAAYQAPSVGLMQPWRFMRITDVEIRQQLHQAVDRERINTGQALGQASSQKKQDFLQLKVEGVLQCTEVLIAALPDKREQFIFGRRTLPEMDLASLSCAIQNMWLAARVEGIGMGWVSIFDPEELKSILNMPADSHPVAILCLGPVDQFYQRPMLVEENWAEERPLDSMLSENGWGEQF